MEDNLNMKPPEEQSSTLKQNPKFLLGSLSLIVIGLAIVMGIVFADDDTRPKDFADDQISGIEIPEGPDESYPEPVEVGEDSVQLPRERGDVEILGDPIPVDAEIGYVAPSFKAQLNEGSELVTINPADGTVRLIGFFAHWCPHCQREVPRVANWLEENGIPAEIDILAVSTAVREGTPNYPPSEWFAQEQWPTDVFVDNQDNDLAAAYGLAGFPYWVLVDATGRVVHRSSGELTEEQFAYLVELAISLVPQIT